MTEIWKLSIDPALEVSSLGRVRTVERIVRRGPGDGRFALSPKILKPHILTTGYAQVQGARRQKHTVHRLVACAFVEGFASDLVVNHKNGVKTDNRPDNLEWVTSSENIRHSYRELGRVGWCKGATSKAHPTSKAIVATNLTTGKQSSFDCALDAVRAGIAKDSGSVSRCCNGKARFHNGHTFVFGDERSAA